MTADFKRLPIWGAGCWMISWFESGTTWAALHLTTDWLIRLVMLVYVPQRRTPGGDPQLAAVDFHIPRSRG